MYYHIGNNFDTLIENVGWDSVVGIEQAQEMFPSSKCPDLFSGTNNLIFSGYQISFYKDKVAGA